MIDSLRIDGIVIIWPFSDLLVVLVIFTVSPPSCIADAVFFTSSFSFTRVSLFFCETSWFVVWRNSKAKSTTLCDDPFGFDRSNVWEHILNHNVQHSQ